MEEWALPEILRYGKPTGNTSLHWTPMTFGFRRSLRSKLPARSSPETIQGSCIAGPHRLITKVGWSVAARTRLKVGCAAPLFYATSLAMAVRHCSAYLPLKRSGFTLREPNKEARRDAKIGICIFGLLKILGFASYPNIWWRIGRQAPV